VSRLVVDLDRLAQLVDRMSRLEAQLVRVGDDADARVRVLHAGWSGAAASAQAAAHAQWRAGAAEVHDALVALRAIVSTAHGNYAAAVAANRRMWAP
jgi:WXG100 family type VII secretion target